MTASASLDWRVSVVISWISSKDTISKNARNSQMALQHLESLAVAQALADEQGEILVGAEQDWPFTSYLYSL